MYVEGREARGTKSVTPSSNSVGGQSLFCRRRLDRAELLARVLSRRWCSWISWLFRSESSWLWWSLHWAWW